MSERISFFGAPVDCLTQEETLARIEQAIAARQPLRHTALNVAKLVAMRENAELARDVAESDLVGIDGMGIVIGLKLLGHGAHERVSGIDLMHAVMQRCARRGWRPFVLGARQEQLDAALAEARRLYPGLVFAGSRNGYFAADEGESIAAAIAASGADCLFVAMPTPHKERFLAAHAARLGVPFVMGVGGSIDVLAGHVSRAPRWMQAAGLEWLHRLAMEPRKMFARYARSNTIYAGMLLAALWRGRRSS